MRAFDEWLQKLVNDVAEIPAFWGNAPRDDSGSLIDPPYIVYTTEPTAPIDEAEEWSVSVILYAWARNTFDQCYSSLQALDLALDGTVYSVGGGMAACDRGGLVMVRNEPDEKDERVRCVSSNYIIRYFKEV